jgi:uncharacterized protein (TIGR03905 family)
VCSRQFDLTVKSGIIEDVKIIGGCDGNLKAVRALITGRRAQEVIPLLQGIRCERKQTSCPDQLSRALILALQEENMILRRK